MQVDSQCRSVASMAVSDMLQKHADLIAPPCDMASATSIEPWTDADPIDETTSLALKEIAVPCKPELKNSPSTQRSYSPFGRVNCRPDRVVPFINISPSPLEVTRPLLCTFALQREHMINPPKVFIGIRGNSQFVLLNILFVSLPAIFSDKVIRWPFIRASLTC